MKFTDIKLIDAILSICFAIYIFVHALSHLKEVFDLFFEKVPDGISIDDIKKSIMNTDGVIDVHHIHVWSIDGNYNCATMHIVIDEYCSDIKQKDREVLKSLDIFHTTLELEEREEGCSSIHCCKEGHRKHEHRH